MVIGPEDLDDAFQTACKQNAEASIAVSFGGLIIDNKERIVRLAISNRLPVMPCL